MHTMTTQRILRFTGPSLISWRREDSNWPEVGMSFKKAMEYQVCFVGDTLPKAYCANIEEYRWANGNEGIQVIGAHTSKSCALPVYGLDIPHLGVRAVLSDNFHGWVVSVEAPKPVDLSVLKDRLTTESLNPIFCSGFWDEWVLGSYGQSQQAFTVGVASSYDVYSMFLLIAHQLRV